MTKSTISKSRSGFLMLIVVGLVTLAFTGARWRRRGLRERLYSSTAVKQNGRSKKDFKSERSTLSTDSIVTGGYRNDGKQSPEGKPNFL